MSCSPKLLRCLIMYSSTGKNGQMRGSFYVRDVCFLILQKYFRTSSFDRFFFKIKGMELQPVLLNSSPAMHSKMGQGWSCLYSINLRWYSKSCWVAVVLVCIMDLLTIMDFWTFTLRPEIWVGSILLLLLLF